MCVANIIGLFLLSDTRQIYMDIDVENAFYVFAEDGTYMKFVWCKTTNLYTYDIGE